MSRILEVKIIGLAAVLTKLGATPKKILQAAKRGELKHALRIQRAAQKKIPVDYGNLRASTFTASAKGKDSGISFLWRSFTGDDAKEVKNSTYLSIRRCEKEAEDLLAQFRQTVFVGFGANYAFFVHESKQKWKGRKIKRGKGRWHVIWGTGEPKFLEKAVAEVGGHSGLLRSIRDELSKEIEKMWEGS